MKNVFRFLCVFALSVFAFDSSANGGAPVPVLLNSDLSALGLSSVFASQPGFNRMCSDVVFVSDFRQKVRVIVDEEGSEAAAATSDTVVPISVVDAQMHVNRPFVYVISEQSTGAILFIGVQE